MTTSEKVSREMAALCSAVGVEYYSAERAQYNAKLPYAVWIKDEVVREFDKDGYDEIWYINLNIYAKTYADSVILYERLLRGLRQKQYYQYMDIELEDTDNEIVDDVYIQRIKLKLTIYDND